MDFFKNSVHRILFPAAAATLLLATTALGAEGTDTTTDHHEAVFGFGVHGGMNFSNFTVNDNTITNARNSRTGSIFGIHMEGMSLGVATLRLELNYSIKGYELTNYVKVNHNYLQIPVLFRISPIVGPIEIFGEIGPAAALHLSTDTTVANTTVNYNANSDNWDFSLIAGVGVGFKLDNILLEVEGRYDYGLSNLSDTNNVEIKSRAIQAIAGVTFLMH